MECGNFGVFDSIVKVTQIDNSRVYPTKKMGIDQKMPQSAWPPNNLFRQC